MKLKKKVGGYLAMVDNDGSHFQREGHRAKEWGVVDHLVNCAEAQKFPRLSCEAQLALKLIEIELRQRLLEEIFAED